MKPSAVPASPDDAEAHDAQRASEDEGTGVPGFRTWAGIYWFVFGSFVLWVGLLALLTAALS